MFSHLTFIAIPAICTPFVAVVLENFRAGTVAKVFGACFLLASVPIGYFAALTNAMWLYQSLYFSALALIALMATQAMRSKFLVVISIINALFLHSLNVYASEYEVPFSVTAASGLFALVLSNYAIHQYDTDSDMHELASIAYWIMNMSDIKSDIVKNTVAYLAILPGAPLQFGLLAYCATAFAAGHEAVPDEMRLLSKLFMISLMYSMVNITMYFSITVTPLNVGHAWLCMMNMFMACSVNSFIGEFEQIWFMAILGLFGWTSVRLQHSPEEITPSALFGGGSIEDGKMQLKKSGRV